MFSYCIQKLFLLCVVRFSQSCSNCSNSIIFWRTQLELFMALQINVILNPIRFEKPSVKIISELLTKRNFRVNVYIYMNTPLSAILYFIHFPQVKFLKTMILHICTKCKVNWTFGLRGDQFWRFLQNVAVQEDPSWRTLWVFKAFLLPWEIRQVYQFSGVLE